MLPALCKCWLPDSRLRRLRAAARGRTVALCAWCAMLAVDQPAAGFADCNSDPTHVMHPHYVTVPTTEVHTTDKCVYTPSMALRLCTSAKLLVGPMFCRPIQVSPAKQQLLVHRLRQGGCMHKSLCCAEDQCLCSVLPASAAADLRVRGRLVLPPMALTVAGSSAGPADGSRCSLLTAAASCCSTMRPGSRTSRKLAQSPRL